MIHIFQKVWVRFMRTLNRNSLTLPTLQMVVVVLRDTRSRYCATSRVPYGRFYNNWLRRAYETKTVLMYNGSLTAEDSASEVEKTAHEHYFVTVSPKNSKDSSI